jgi:hypothetical protein
VALGVDAQPVESIRQKAYPAKQSLGFHRVLLAASEHKRSIGGDEIKGKNKFCDG